MKRKVERGFYITLKQQIVWIISTAFAIAAALFWKDTFTLIANIYMKGQTLTYSIYASTIFTLLAILIIWIIHKIFKE